MCSGEQCDLTIEKDGHIIDDGKYAVGISGQINQIYCKALCSGSGPTPALKWYKIPSMKPVRRFRGRVYQVRTTFDRVNILTVRNMLYSDIGRYKCRGWLKNQGWMEKAFELTYACKGLSHLCDTSKCISQDKLCDGMVDCTDGTDEQNCKVCTENQFQCSNGDCINAEFVCDKFRDCADASDEHDCGCRPDYQCAQGGCIPHDKVCDGILDCNFGEDEVNCTYCEMGEYHCGKRVCIPVEHVCNGIPECLDASDESNCGIKVNIVNPMQEVLEGETVRFKCEATVRMDHIDYEVTWSKQQGNMSRPISSDGSTLVISEVNLNDSGIYMCTGRDSISFDTDLAELIVNQRCPGNFECSDGTCISTELVCNRHADCPGGNDELDCEFCDTDTFDCGDGVCVLNDVVCDGNHDCENGTDEIDCCVDKFQCLDGSCVDVDRWCDGFPDCSDEEDENNCTYCEVDEFHCGFGVCIPQSKVCDHENHCDDASDESDCGCYDDFTCGSGTCIDISKVCDGKIDCNEDGEDELDCECKHYQFQCDDGSCINSTYRCDHVNDCPTSEDENNCTCYTDSFRCDHTQCVNQSLVCNGVEDCSNAADEENCTEITCKEDGEFRCESKDECIPMLWRCDGSADCIDGSDECGCSPSEYRCNDGMCIDATRQCDGVPDCEFEDDEETCHAVICLEGQTLCPDKSRCITTFQYCDQHPDCDDGSDESEQQCGTVSSEATRMKTDEEVTMETTTEDTDVYDYYTNSDYEYDSH